MFYGNARIPLFGGGAGPVGTKRRKIITRYTHTYSLRVIDFASFLRYHCYIIDREKKFEMDTNIDCVLLEMEREIGCLMPREVWWKSLGLWVGLEWDVVASRNGYTTLRVLALDTF